MHLLIIIFALLVIVFLADKVGLWLERKGHLYYRYNKPRAGAVGSTLLELNAQLSPANRYVVEVKNNKVQFKKSDAVEF